MVGMRTSSSPTLAAFLTSPSRLKLFADPQWRGRCRRSLVSVASQSQPPSRYGYGKPPFRFETGIGLFAKRSPRPFPPPFLSPPSVSFSDPLSTHHQSRDRRARAFVNGELIKGLTNGDDAVLWSRLILHFWATAIEEESAQNLFQQKAYQPDPIASLQTAFEQTQEATGAHDWQGTTTACGAQLHYKMMTDAGRQDATPVLYVTNLGDCQVLVLRPRDQGVVFKTTEQWHWFDCPRQLGTNSPDTPRENAVVDVVDLEEGDVVLAMSDGVIDNLWGHEIATRVFQSIKEWEAGKGADGDTDRTGGRNGGMAVVAQDLVAAAKVIALDPYAESPFMEHAIEEGLASEGGKLDDISVVAALCLWKSFQADPSQAYKMRGKRSKQYRKLMEQFSMTFGFREPYQILVDAEMIKDANRCTMDLAARLQSTVHGKVKPLITQCEIRKLYAEKDQPGVNAAIELAKTFERRRCGHHPNEYPKPLETMECMRSVVDPKSTGENKHRYVVASQSLDVRRMLRGIRGVPLIYIKRSVMILEPMADESVQIREREEKRKFRAELKNTLGKRKREEKEERNGDEGEGDDDGSESDDDDVKQGKAAQESTSETKPKKNRGTKGANPLSMKKKKPQQLPKKEAGKKPEAVSDAPAKRKRRKKTKPENGTTSRGPESSTVAPSNAGEES
ncbi:Fcf1 domain-containing protein [Trichoderma compactum]